MKVDIPGHSYRLSNHDKPDTSQVLQFIQKEPLEEGDTELQTVIDGTTNEEVLAVLVNRMEYLNSKFPCREKYTHQKESHHES